MNPRDHIIVLFGDFGPLPLYHDHLQDVVDKLPEDALPYILAIVNGLTVVWRDGPRGGRWDRHYLTSEQVNLRHQVDRALLDAGVDYIRHIDVRQFYEEMEEFPSPSEFLRASNVRIHL